MTWDQLLMIAAHHPLVTWVAVACVFLILELANMKGWMLWPAAAAGITALISRVTTIDFMTQAAVFVGMTAITTYIGRALTTTGSVKSVAPAERERRIVGLAGKAITSFRGGAGRVFIDGKEWAAELEGPGPVHSGDDVYVVRVTGGSRLRVRLSKH